MIRTIIIEDEALIRKSLFKLVSESSLGFDIVGEGSNGNEGLHIAQRMAPNLIITDIKMPLMSGLDLIKNVKSLGIECEFIILSGYGDFSYAQEAIHYGVSDYLLKPIRPEQLIQTLHNVKIKLEKSQIDWNEYNDWLVYCSEEVKNIGHSIWNVNETEVLASINSFNEKWMGSSVNASQFKARTIEFLSRVHTYLENYLGARKLDYNKQMILAGNHIEEIQGLYKQIIYIWLHTVREFRYCGAHLNIKHVLTFIENNYKDTELSLQVAADHINLSVPYVSKVFKQQVGMPFSTYLIQTRMEKAKQLLSDPDCKASGIPELIGYTDYPHFTKTFKKIYGVSPREFRRSLDLP
jgi:two-component system response regulator YesN